MKKGELKKKTGFTIIEVSLVLAIAGLIFLMVFIALPQLQRQQRDSRRRDDILSFLETVKKYQTNNRGALPSLSGLSSTRVMWDRIITDESDEDYSEWEGFYADYLGDRFVDPDGEHYKLYVLNCSATRAGQNCSNSELSGLSDSSFPNDYQLYVVLQAECSGESAVKTSNPRKIATLYRLEGAGVYCANT
ncbi:type II secretion system protein [Candidatus Nanosyncoccus alces]|uniref:Type II secretion system protein n=1 Tax=Candidatus Nanosyncoccus alces TaxID=2171997 RepID=A0ABY0FMB5_9BACT|nr:prepilin-type N-terminal cleavage/methylation domain-containing protein [Candidatus Nanosyncoccus alces]RYC75019.1 hypothetical protein G3RUM_00300 [Candidatus Nanosyncoccus alces]